MCRVVQSISIECTHLVGVCLYFLDVGFADAHFCILMCKSHIVINSPKRVRLLGHISSYVVLVIDDNAFAD